MAKKKLCSRHKKTGGEHAEKRFVCLEGPTTVSPTKTSCLRRAGHVEKEGTRRASTGPADEGPASSLKRGSSRLPEGGRLAVISLNHTTGEGDRAGESPEGGKGGKE